MIFLKQHLSWRAAGFHTVHGFASIHFGGVDDGLALPRPSLDKEVVNWDQKLAGRTKCLEDKSQTAICTSQQSNTNGLSELRTLKRVVLGTQQKLSGKIAQVVLNRR